jgi:hypothetical protein
MSQPSPRLALRPYVSSGSFSRPPFGLKAIYQGGPLFRMQSRYLQALIK